MADHRPEEADVASAWNRNADRWTDDVRAGFDLYRDLYTLPAFTAFMPPIDGRKVIDLGCGEGSDTRRFARLGGQLTGIDLSEALIRRAREEEIREPLGIRYEVCSYSRMEAFAAGSFDCALSTMALMDGPDIVSAMLEAHRVLAPGGTLCFSVLHPCFVTRGLEWLRSADGACSGLQVGHYFNKAPFVEHWRFSKRPEPNTVQPFEVPRFPRTLSDYVNTVCDAGFRITKIDEPRPDKVASQKHAWLSRWYEHAPLVLFIAALKA
jgi:ubiquinone/menaquinone biosynthesis C-methylase UbiE